MINSRASSGGSRRSRSAGLRGVLAAVAAAALLAPLLGGSPAFAAGAEATAAEKAAALAAQDPCGGQCRDILPAGQNGHASLVEILLHKAVGTRPKHSADQLGPYDKLLHEYSGLSDEKLSDYFNDASFGVPEDQVESVKKPRADVTITRDKATGTPHIKGTTRSGTEFGAGYAAGQDRLWLIDVLRHVGRGQLSSFAGGAEGNRELEQSLWAVAPYTEDDLQAQVERIRDSGERGAQAYQDIKDYVSGLNAFVDDTLGALNHPGEYVLTGNGSKIKDFTVTDVVAIASVIGAIFGNGGGGEVGNALAKLAFQKQYGDAGGEKAYTAWRAQNDAGATTTVHGKEFPYAQSPRNPRGVATPESGSVTAFDHSQNEEGAGASARKKTGKDGGAKPDGVLPGDLITAKKGMSNALMVSGKHTASGNPVAVFGPQTGYYSPQIMMVQELDGPGLRSRGASFPGLSFYVELGRGLDYSWSATSAGQDITDTFAVELCEESGAEPTTESQSYMLRGKCTPFEKLSRHNEWKPTLADGTKAGSYDVVTLRSAYGLVSHTGTVDGKPVAFTALRSTYHHDADSVIGFQKFNDPSAITSARSFQKAAQDIGYTFNWFYADADHTAYFNSGDNPVRSKDTDPDQPIRAEKAYEWKDWDPEANTSAVTPPAEHPQSVDQGYFVNWNNKQAESYSAGWANGPVHRGDLLDTRVGALVKEGSVTRAKLVQAMEEAAAVDLRAEKVLPELLDVIGESEVTDPELARTIKQLRAWKESGSQRLEAAKDDGTYEHAEAARVLDVWWPLLVEGQFKPVLGDDLYTSLTSLASVNESPSGGQNGSGGSGGGVGAGQPHKGSSFQTGWWSFVQKDLRSVQGEAVASPLDRPYCGGGSLAECREMLLTTLSEAAATPAEETYPGDDECEPGDQVCADSIVHRAMGGITVPRIAWQNRPTYQQVVEFPARR
ncbi:penicillin acylase family protein [Streptomyces sp. WMMB 322]|uniref:penicillin acylase family protein n=1 Tax=Streptomyces sp. WMMB 322 TaxID=1286821 RepID=UPI000823F8A3|nr:penicillin acylase family protein [Streptomyces sp. WMMB 322]SCK34823.1 Acyl-homoserine lactone (AHL) acylase PvdQ [Streptomyces sp. WMMB 322]